MGTKRYTLRFNKNYFEHTEWSKGRLVCGIDEVGRGCLAGPVMVACVILHPQKTHRLIKDSKILTEEEREKAYQWIIKNSWYTVALIHNRLIDGNNIYQSTLHAMKRAFIQLTTKCNQMPSTLLVDAMPVNLDNTIYKDLDVYYFPFGESKSISIAAASIVAKVTRDRLMGLYDPLFPGYNLKQNKGYATPEHKQGVRTINYTIIHRINFLRGWGLIPSLDEQQQLSLFSPDYIQSLQE